MSTKMAIIKEKLENNKCGKDVGKLEFTYIAGRNVKQYIAL